MKYLILLFNLVFLLPYGHAQENSFLDKTTFKTYYLNTQSPIGGINMVSIGFNATYKINRAFDVGIMTGLGHLGIVLVNPSLKDYPQIPLAGVAEIHLLNLLIKEKELRIDFYTTARLGGMYNKNYNNYFEKEINLYFGLHFGTAYYFSPRFGIFGQWGAEYMTHSYFSHHYGVTYRF